MTRYKMIGKDFNASYPFQYRTWVVDNEPDFAAQYYMGPKAGSNPLIDVVAYAVNDASAIVDFLLPEPANWRPIPLGYLNDFPILELLPNTLEDSSIVIIGDYLYAFGGKLTSSIFQASINDPAIWIDTGATLPKAIYGSSFAVVGETIYLFGGNDGYNPIDNIYSASISDPLVWTDHGHLLPIHLDYSSLGMYNGELYLFGGRKYDGSPIANIFTASTSSPLSWTDTGSTLPQAIYGSTIAQLAGFWYLFGGQTSFTSCSNSICSAAINLPTTWNTAGTLPYATAFSQFVSVGNDGYLIGPIVSDGYDMGFTGILQGSINNPTYWIDTEQTVPASLSHSNLAIVDNQVWLFGGSGNLGVFACNQLVKFNIGNPVAIAYGNITETIFNETDNAVNPFQVLGLPIWKTDYTGS